LRRNCENWSRAATGTGGNFHGFRLDANKQSGPEFQRRGDLRKASRMLLGKVKNGSKSEIFLSEGKLGGVGRIGRIKGRDWESPARKGNWK